MDPVTIATSVLAVLAPYAIKGAKAFGEAAGEVGLAQAKKLLDTLKHHFSGDDETGPVIQNFEKKPERYGSVLQDVVREKVSQDPTLASELQSQLEKMGPVLHIVQEMDIGRNVTAVDADQMSSGSVDAVQRIRDAQGVTGLKIKKIGG
jgi:hypothetical protein